MFAVQSVNEKQNVDIKQFYNQQIAYIKNRKYSYIFQLLSLAIFRKYQY
jgi:hypothetical protein